MYRLCVMGVCCRGYVLWGYSVEVMCYGVFCRGHVLWGYSVEVMCYGGIL